MIQIGANQENLMKHSKSTILWIPIFCVDFRSHINFACFKLKIMILRLSWDRSCQKFEIRELRKSEVFDGLLDIFKYAKVGDTFWLPFFWERRNISVRKRLSLNVNQNTSRRWWCLIKIESRTSLQEFLEFSNNSKQMWNSLERCNSELIVSCKQV